MTKQQRSVRILSALVMIELIVIACLCCRYINLKKDYERISQRFSELYGDFKEKVAENGTIRSDYEKHDRILWDRYRNGKLPVRVCPHCKGEVLPLTYGLIEAADSINYDLNGKMRFILAGCEVRDAEWRCVSCGREFITDGKGLTVARDDPDRPWSTTLGDVEKKQYLRVSFSRVEAVGIEAVSLCDITGDDVPEVWLMTEGSEADRMVLVYSLRDWDRELFRETAGHSLFYAGKGYVLRQCAHLGDAFWYRIRWDGEKMQSEMVFEETVDSDYTTPLEDPFVEIRPEELDPNELFKWVK